MKTCEVMMRVFDVDSNGWITVHEFAKLWEYISSWKQCFDGYDRDRSGNIDFNEFKTAITSFGYRMSDGLLVKMMQKFDPQRRGCIEFDAFIQINFLLQSMTSSFRNFDTDQDGWVQLSYE